MSTYESFFKKHLDTIQKDKGGRLTPAEYAEAYQKADELATAEVQEKAEEDRDKFTTILDEMESVINSAREANEAADAASRDEEFLNLATIAYTKLIDREGQHFLYNEKREKGRRNTSGTSSSTDGKHWEEDSTVRSAISGVHRIERLQNGTLQLITSGRWKRCVIEDDSVLEGTGYDKAELAHNGNKKIQREPFDKNTFLFLWERDSNDKLTFIRLAEAGENLGPVVTEPTDDGEEDASD